MLVVPVEVTEEALGGPFLAVRRRVYRRMPR
jgi:hypothetical protein